MGAMGVDDDEFSFLSEQAADAGIPLASLPRVERVGRSVDDGRTLALRASQPSSREMRARL